MSGADFDQNRWSLPQGNLTGLGIVASYSVRFWTLVIGLGVITGLAAAGLIALLRLVERLSYGVHRATLLAAVEAAPGWRRLVVLMVAAVIVILGLRVIGRSSAGATEVTGDADAKPNGRAYRAGKWVERRGRPRGDVLTYDAAREKVPAVLASFQAARSAHDAEAHALRVEAERPRTFRELAQEWRAYLNRKGTKPATLVGYGAMLSEPGVRYRRGRGQTRGYIMAAIGDMPAREMFRLAT